MHHSFYVESANFNIVPKFEEIDGMFVLGLFLSSDKIRIFN